MAGGVVRVLPDSVIKYQDGAKDQFSSIHTNLTNMIESVVNVRYFGPNAMKFKTECGQLATEFANKLSEEVGGIVGVVNTATSNIAGSLGEGRLALTWEAKPFTAPTPAAGDGAVDVDHGALGELKTAVAAKFDDINNLLGQHLQALVATDWTGVAKDTVSEEVTGRTTRTQATVTENANKLNTVIQQQIDDVVAADKA